MNGEHETGDRRHTDPGISTREYLLRILDERDKATQIRHEAQEAALTLATTRLEQRLEGLNQLRSEVLQDRAEFVRKDAFEAGQQQRDARIRALEDTSQSRGALIEQFHKAQAEIEALQSAIIELRQTSASQEAVNSFKRILYAAAATAAVAFGVALFNLATKAGT